MSVADARAAVCEVGRRLWQRGMVAANDGNISVRVGPDSFLCTPTGVSKGNLRAEDLPIVDGSGQVLGGGGLLPSSEIRMHLGVYAVDPEVHAVVHAHPMYSTVWAIKGEGLSGPMMPETVVAMPEVPLAPYATPSTDAVPDSVKPLVLSHRGCLLEHHGALTWGTDLEQAYLAMERLEYTAQVTYLLRQIGGERYLPADEVARLNAIFGTGR